MSKLTLCIIILGFIETEFLENKHTLDSFSAVKDLLNLGGAFTPLLLGSF